MLLIIPAPHSAMDKKLGSDEMLSHLSSFCELDTLDSLALASKEDLLFHQWRALSGRSTGSRHVQMLCCDLELAVESICLGPVQALHVPERLAAALPLLMCQ